MACQSAFRNQLTFRRSDFLCSVVRSYDGETERKKLNGVGFRIQAELLASNEKETDSSEGKQ